MSEKTENGGPKWAKPPPKKTKAHWSQTLRPLQGLPQGSQGGAHNLCLLDTPSPDWGDHTSGRGPLQLLYHQWSWEPSCKSIAQPGTQRWACHPRQAGDMQSRTLSAPPRPAEGPGLLGTTVSPPRAARNASWQHIPESRYSPA